MPAKRRIVVAGAMLELGPAGEELHRQAGRHVASKKIDFLLGVRGQAEQMVEAARQAGMPALYVASPEEAGEWLSRETHDGDVVLLKGSRGEGTREVAVATVISRPSLVAIVPATNGNDQDKTEADCFTGCCTKSYSTIFRRFVFSAI